LRKWKRKFGSNDEGGHMPKPIFVETSDGHINIALIEWARIDKDKNMVLINFASNMVSVSVEEWHKILSKMGEFMLD
jgi:hypothetical protein